jgi:hypothetical protein
MLSQQYFVTGAIVSFIALGIALIEFHTERYAARQTLAKYGNGQNDAIILYLAGKFQINHAFHLLMTVGTLGSWVLPWVMFHLGNKSIRTELENSVYTYKWK